jgi:hypothetical protein
MPNFVVKIQSTSLVILRRLAPLRRSYCGAIKKIGSHRRYYPNRGALNSARWPLLVGVMTAGGCLTRAPWPALFSN